MAIDHKFKATSANMFSSNFSLDGHFVLNGGVNAEGSVEIKSSANPGEEAAFFTGELTNPKVSIESNSAGFNALAERLRSAHSVEIRFTSSRDLVSTPAQTRFDSFNISTRRTFS